MSNETEYRLLEQLTAGLIRLRMQLETHDLPAKPYEADMYAAIKQVIYFCERQLDAYKEQTKLEHGHE